MMDANPRDQHARLDATALGVLMPMHLCLSETGRITCCGPTLGKLVSSAEPAGALVGLNFFERFEIRRPSGLATVADLRRVAGQRLYLGCTFLPGTGFRGLAVPLAQGEGVLLNLSFGIGIIDAVRDHALTVADFAATELAIELLYVVEAKSAVMEELRGLNLRLEGARSEAEERALTDTLTGLRNRRALDLDLRRALAMPAPFGLMHIDLDYFKAVNDTLGHAAGDHVLCEVARVLKDETRSNDCVARVGGDEFVILLPGLDDAARMEQIAARIIARLAIPIPYDGSDCRISASIGMTLSTSYALPQADPMLADADQALYAAKHAGRGCVRMHPVTEMGA